MVLEWLSALRYWDGRNDWREGIVKAAHIMYDYGMVQELDSTEDWT
jgi:hypothetical protein